MRIGRVIPNPMLMHGATLCRCSAAGFRVVSSNRSNNLDSLFQKSQLHQRKKPNSHVQVRLLVCLPMVVVTLQQALVRS